MNYVPLCRHIGSSTIHCSTIHVGFIHRRVDSSHDRSFVCRIIARSIHRRVNNHGSIHRKVDSLQDQFVTESNHRRVMSTENLIETWNILSEHTKLGSFFCKNFFVADCRLPSFLRVLRLTLLFARLYYLHLWPFFPHFCVCVCAAFSCSTHKCLNQINQQTTVLWFV
jgi:hypothetical protein